MGQGEWNKPKVIFLSLFWIWGIIGASIFFYGMYQYMFLQQQEYRQLVLTGLAVIFSGNLFALIVGKVLNRNRDHH